MKPQRLAARCGAIRRWSIQKIQSATMAPTTVCRAQHPLGPRDQRPLPREGLCWFPPTKYFPASGLQTGSGLLRWIPPTYAAPSIHWAPVISFHCHEKACVGSADQVLSRFRRPPDRGCCVGIPPTYAASSIHWTPVISFHCYEKACVGSADQVLSRSGLHRIGVWLPASTGPYQPS